MSRRPLWPLVVALAACGAPAAPLRPATPAPRPMAPGVAAAPSPPPAPRDPSVGPHGEGASLAGRTISMTLASGQEVVVEPSELHPPAVDPSLIAVLATAFAYLDDGTLMVGVADGSLTALDGEGHRRWSLGLRGAVRGITPVAFDEPPSPEKKDAAPPTGGRAFVATTESGVVALITSEGRVRWERQLTPDNLSPAVITGGPSPPQILVAGARGVLAFSPAGELAFTHAASLEENGSGLAPALSVEGDTVIAGKARFLRSDPHPPIADPTPTFPLTYRRVLEGNVLSLLAPSPSEILALVSGGKRGVELVRIDGDRTTRIPIRTTLDVDGLTRGPGGEPWIVARRGSHEEGMPPWSKGPARGSLLEVRGTAITERKDLQKAFADHPLDPYEPIALAPAASATFFCFSHNQPACAVHGPSGFELFTPPKGIASVARTGAVTWAVDTTGALYRLAGRSLAPFSGPDAEMLEWVAGSSEADVWAYPRFSYRVHHHDGTRWSSASVPITLEGISARARDDAWSTSGRAHWDGSRWSLVAGVPAASSLIARGPGDVWLGGKGLWHGTTPGPTVIHLPRPAATDDGAAPTPAPLSLAAPETRYLTERARVEVPGGDPVSAAKRVASTREGVVWIEAWDRLIEVDPAGKARTLRRGERIGLARWFYPEGQGQGFVLERDPAKRVDERDALRRLSDGKPSGDEQVLDFHDLVAVDGTPRGFTWALGVFASTRPGETRAFSAFELAPHALVKSPSLPVFHAVVGLPSAAWIDVAASPDGGAWFAGGLSDGPSGEGILVHARGPAGTDGTSRFRARASLLSVGAAGSNEAWAVGVGGTVVHVRGEEITRLALPSGAWLRAVAAAGPDDVWLGGDGGTLLHYDGREIHPVDHPLGPRAAFTGIAIVRGTVWAVGPSGMVRIRRR